MYFASWTQDEELKMPKESSVPDANNWSVLEAVLDHFLEDRIAWNFLLYYTNFDVD